MLTSSFSIAEKEAKKLVQKNSSVKQFLDGHPAQTLTTRCVPLGQHLSGWLDKKVFDGGVGFWFFFANAKRTSQH